MIRSRSAITLSALLLCGLPAVTIAENAVTPGTAESLKPKPAAAASDDTSRQCVDLLRIRNTRVLDSRTILFTMNGGEKLINRLPHNCPGLGFERRFGYKTSLHSLCNVDIIFVVTDHGRGATCGLGMFEKYVEPEKVTAPTADGELKSEKSKSN
jgi:hypothetical protein